MNRVYMFVIGLALLALGGLLVSGLLDWLIRMTGVIMMFGGIVAVIVFFRGGRKNRSSDW